jgi:hypothetical protein
MENAAISPGELPMTENEALEAAKRIANERGWIGFKPVRASVERRWIIHFDEYVDANADGRGHSGSIEIDDTTGQLTFAEFRMEIDYPSSPEEF